MLLADADGSTITAYILPALAALFAYLAGRDKLKLDARVVLLEKTNTDRDVEIKKLKRGYKGCRRDRRDLRNELNELKQREADRYGPRQREPPAPAAAGDTTTPSDDADDTAP